MVAPAVEGIDLFKIAGRSISGWIPSFKAGTVSHVRQPFCSQLEERLLLWLEYNPQVISYARGDIGPQFATTYRLPTPKHAPFAIGYTFEGDPHDYLPDVVGTLDSGKMFIAEAGMEDDKRGDRNLAKVEAAREQGREVRARIQDEAGSHRKRRAAHIRQVEQSRQWDRQREDIHPVEVLERSVRYPFAPCERSRCHDPSPLSQGNFHRDGL